MDPASVQLTIAPAVPLAALEWNADFTSASTQSTAALGFSTSYSVTVAGSASDGIELEATTQFAFTTQPAPDATAPQVLASTPSNGASSVALEAKLSLVFSEAISTGTLVVTMVPEWGVGEPTWSTDRRSVTFESPAASLAGATDYVVTVNAADDSGNSLTGTRTFAFRTRAAPDALPPTVLSSTPADGAMGVSTNVTPALSFSEAMNLNAAKAAFSIAPPIPGGCTPAFDPSGTLLSCPHNAPLSGDTTYTVTLTTGASDVTGNALAQTFTTSFKTSTVPDTTAPTIVSVTPATTSRGAPFRPLIAVTFSEPMDPGATQASFTISQPLGLTGTFGWNAAGTVMTFTTTSAELLPGQEVRWQLANTAKDLAGNALGSATQLYSFFVRRVGNATIPASAVTAAGYVESKYDLSSKSLRIGDTSSNTSTRGILAFDLRSVRSDILEFTSVTLNVYLESISASASVLGVLGVQAFSNPPLFSAGNEKALFEVETKRLLCALERCSDFAARYEVGIDSKVAGMKNVVVTAFMAQAYRARLDPLEFRFLTYTTNKVGATLGYTTSNGDSINHAYYFSLPTSLTLANRPTMSLTYTYP
jgi:methionine-rich copper-binding protein CopC